MMERWDEMRRDTSEETFFLHSLAWPMSQDFDGPRRDYGNENKGSEEETDRPAQGIKSKE